MKKKRHRTQDNDNLHTWGKRQKESHSLECNDTAQGKIECAIDSQTLSNLKNHEHRSHHSHHHHHRSHHRRHGSKHHSQKYESGHQHKHRKNKKSHHTKSTSTSRNSKHRSSRIETNLAAASQSDSDGILEDPSGIIGPSMAIEPLSSKANDTKENIKIYGALSKKQTDIEKSRVRRVFDPHTGRTRLVRGSGEIIESIVSKKEHDRINRIATRWPVG